MKHFYSLLLLSSLLLSTPSKAQLEWSELGGLNNLAAGNTIKSICAEINGNIYACGLFLNNQQRSYVAKWNGSQWSELIGSNTLNANSTVNVVSSDAAGNIYAAGWFTNSASNKYVAKWNGSSWSELGGANGLSANSWINCVVADNNGNIYAAGNFTNASGNYYVAKFNGSTWSELGGLNGLAANHRIHAICIGLAGEVYTAGEFNDANGKCYVARFNGTTWSEVPGMNIQATGTWIGSLAYDASGNLYATGNFTNSAGRNYVAKWNGTLWTELGGFNSLAPNAQIMKLACGTAGVVYAGGYFSNGSNLTTGKRYVAKWDGITWSELGGLNALSANDAILDICIDTLGNVLAAGEFTNLQGKRYVASYGSTFSNESGLSLSKDLELQLFPNPVATELQLICYFKRAGYAKLTLLDAQGRELEILFKDKTETEKKYNFLIDAAKYTKGLYYVLLENEDRDRILKKLIISN